MKQKGTLFLTQGAMIGALYVALTLVFAPISFGEVQLRVAEALTILPMFTPAAIPGLFVGCLIGNILGGALLPDILCGSLATLLGALGTYALRRLSPLLGCLPPIVSNTVIVPLVLRYAYGIRLPLWALIASVGLGEVLGCGLLGCLLHAVLRRHQNVLFRTQKS